MGTEAKENTGLDLNAASEVAQDFKLLQARNSKAYVATMVDICSAVNNCPMGKMKNLDVDELRNQTGHLLYYAIKGVDDPIPCDLEFVPQLHSHFRKPTILVLKRIQKFLMATHRRVLGRLEREQALEKIMDMGAFDVSQKIRLALDEMRRYESMSKMVKGGGRKLDILMQALKVPSRARFELLLVDRILRDPHHIRHNEALKWLAQSKFKGNRNAVHSLVNNGFQMLDNAGNRILEIMEDLSGLQFPRDNGSIDVHQNWYSLGKALPRGEEFVKTFTAEEKVEHKIKRLTYPMVRVGWDVERMRAQKDRLLVDLNVAKIQAAQLSNLFFDLEKKIASSTKPDGEVMIAIETDFNNGMLSTRERDDAEAWVRENKIKLQELMMEIYESLHELKEKNPKIALPAELEDTISRIKSGHAGDRQEQLKGFETEIDKLSIADIAKKVSSLESKMDSPNEEVFSELFAARGELVQRINHISIRNIDFHKKVRNAYQDFEEYENKVLELYGMEEQLEQMRINVEKWLLNCFRTVSFVSVPEKTLAGGMEVVIEAMLIDLKKLDYGAINADMFQESLDKAMKMEEEDGLLHLDYLLQEINAVPRSDQLLSALHDWEKDLGKAEVAKKESWVLDNDAKLQEIGDKARSELRERINSSKKPLSRRLRFEVFGLSDCLAENLLNILHGLLSTEPRLANAQEGEMLVKSLQSLEAQVIEAQKTTKPDGEAFKKLKQMEQNGQIESSVAQELFKELKLNFSELDQVLEETSQGLKSVSLSQNRFGAKKETDYLDVTLNINDLERLKDVYDFIETVTMQDIKRFCVSYNLKSGLVSNLFEKARKKDLSVPKDILALFNTKAYKAFKEKRYISLSLKTLMMKSSQEIFEAECQLLCHTLNLVNPMNIRKKASYMGIVTILGQAKEADHQMVKALGLIWGRVQSRLFKFEPINHKKNFEGNRTAIMNDVKDVSGDKFKR